MSTEHFRARSPYWAKRPVSICLDPPRLHNVLRGQNPWMGARVSAEDGYLTHHFVRMGRGAGTRYRIGNASGWSGPIISSRAP